MIKKPWLYLPPSLIHFLTPFALKIYSRLFPSKNSEWLSFQWRNLYFKNPLGIAGGVDKNSINLKDWERLGSGFYEIGTVTPQTQKAHRSKNIDRNISHLSLWNHLGFPNQGSDRIKKRLSSFKPLPFPLFINIGKNRETPLEDSSQDYLESIQKLHSFADVFVINISSPNSPQLQSLFKKETLSPLLKTLKKTCEKYSTPLLLKIHPDLEEEEFFRVIDESLSAGIDGWIFCNTTQSRSISNLFPSYGGISGKPLAPLSLEGLKKLKNYLKQKEEFKDQLIVSVGGVLTPKDVLERLELGAHLVQVYSALVFEGPSFFQKVYKYIKNQKTTG